MRILLFLLSAKRNVVVLFIIICFLIVQAYCDLALPRYTSDIVDVGILRGGIENAVPDQIREESLADLELFMQDSEIKTVDNAFQKNAQGKLSLQIPRSDTEEIDHLNDILQIPMLILSAAQNKEAAAGLMPAGADLDIAKLRQAYAAGMMTKEQLLEIRTAAEDAMEKMGDTTAGSAAARYVESEYKAMGMDMQKIQMDYMIDMGVRMILFTLVSILSAILVCFLASYTAARVTQGLREELFLKILDFSATEMNKFTGASLITRSTNDLQQIQIALVMTMRLVLLAPIMGIGGIIMVVGTHTGMGWIVVAAVAMLLLVVIVLLVITMPKFKRLQVLIDKLNLISREILTGLSVIRAFCREKFEGKRFARANENLMKTQLFTNRTMSLMFPIIMFLMNFVTVGIVWFGAKGIDLGDLQVGSMMAFITYTMQIVMSFMMLSMIAIMMPRANVAAERLHEVRTTEISIHDKPADQLIRRETWTGRIVFDDVSFHFPGAKEDALKNISFTAEPGKTTAIIGSTGSGKSTLINLIPRLYDVTGGAITIDGVDIRDMSQHDLRQILGVVPQKGVLFSGDIRSNLKFGSADISEGELEKAAEIAQAADFIREKDGGYESPISQGGSNVSGGQKQRLAIARAIAKNPPVFLFDDSFSALDFKTDTALRQALRTNLADATIIVVAQRIATIMGAEQIIVLDDGEIVGIGTHRALLESCEVYREIASGQLSEAELSA